MPQTARKLPMPKNDSLDIAILSWGRGRSYKSKNCKRSRENEKFHLEDFQFLISEQCKRNYFWVYQALKTLI